MLSLILATCFFVGIHLFISGTTLRDKLVERLTEGGYMGLFSLLSLGGIVWMSMAYSRAPHLGVWGEIPGIRSVTLVVTFVAFVLTVVGFTTPSPTAAGGEALLDSDEPATGILRVTRHPGMWSIAVWAFVHLLANGDAASLVFFGGLMVLSFAGPFSIDAKRARKLGAKWTSFASVTSNVPFGAILSGRNQLVLGEIPIWKMVVGVAVWVAFLMGHQWLFGVSPFPA